MLKAMKLRYGLMAGLLVLAGCGAEESSAEVEDIDPVEVEAQTPLEENSQEVDEPVGEETSIDEVDTSNADFPVVLAVEAEPRDGNEWNFSVTLSSQYDTPERYADAWRVLDAEGAELGIRVLLHDHANEQPFTRSQVIEVPAETDTVFIEGRDLVNGWSSELTEYELALN